MNKKNFYLVGITVLIIIGIAVWHFISEKQQSTNDEQKIITNDRQEITVISDGANFTPEQNIKLQQGLVNSVGKYTEAAIMTNSVFSTDIEKTDYAEWRTKLDKAVQLWEELEVMDKQMNDLLDELKISETPSFTFRPSDVGTTDTQRSKFISTVYADSGAPIPELGAVTAVFDSSSYRNKLRQVMEVFDWDAKKALTVLKQEQNLFTAGAWDKAGDTYQRWETGARIIKDASKVTIFIASNVITAGSATAAAGAFQGVAVVVGGVSLAIEIGEDINIAVGNEDNAAVLRQAQEDMSVITHLVSIASLKDIGDPNNLFYIADTAGKLCDYAKDGYVYLTRGDDGKIFVSKQKPKNVNIAKPRTKSEPSKVGLVAGNYIVDGEKIEVKKEETEAIDVAEELSQFEAPEKPVIDPNSTKIKTGEVNNLSLEIPEGLNGPFDIESIEVGGLGAAVALPSESDSKTIDGQFISSNPGLYVVEVKIRDADGNIHISKTTISVEGEPTGQSEEEDVDINEYIEEEQVSLNGNVTVNNSIYYVPEDDLPHKRKGSGTMNLTILEDVVSGSCYISAKDYYKCPAFYGDEVVETCVSRTGEEYKGGSWISDWEVDFPGGSVQGTYYPSTGKIEARVGEHHFTGTLVGNKASGKFYYELPNGEPAFFWSTIIQ